MEEEGHPKRRTEGSERVVPKLSEISSIAAARIGTLGCHAMAVKEVCGPESLSIPPMYEDDEEEEDESGDGTLNDVT